MSGIDWKLASSLAAPRRRRRRGPPHLPGDLAARCERAQELVVSYTGLEPASDPPAPEAVDRAGWIEANLTSFKATLDPVVERAGARLGSTTSPLAIAGTALISAEVGAITGYLARRVLGQYELALLDPGAHGAAAVRRAEPRGGGATTSRPTAARCLTGSHSTRSPMSCSSPPCRGCASGWRG